MRFSCLLCAFAAIGLAQQPEPPRLRLDGSLVPLRYRLDLTIVPEAERFSGTVEIDAKLGKSTSLLWLNATELDVESATIRAGSREWTARAVGAGNGFLSLATEQAVPAGQVLLRIRYSAPFNRRGDASGLFVVKDGGASYLYTHFEPLEARRAFPCFDEPSYKVPWSVTLHVPGEHKAFANGAMLSETNEENGLKKVRFKETRPLPTYLIALAVGPFEIVEVGPAGRAKTQLRLIVPRGRTERTAFAREITPKVFASLEDYFGIPFPYDKLDQIAVPIAGMGAMENAGLITYREELIVAPTSGDSVQRRRASAYVIAHEIAHHWFGNLVTLAWWDDIWLNEAFASWIEDRVLDRIQPEWRPLVGAQSTKVAAMRNDSVDSARQIRQPIESQGDIGQAFDSITYLKGATVIRMFENYLGPEPFRKGVQAYLRRHAWGNATSSDFLAALSSAAGRDVGSAFSTFLNRSGVPLLRVGLDCNGRLPQLTVRQERYVSLGSKMARETYWQVPVCFRYENGTKIAGDCALITDPRQTIPLKQAQACPAWVFADQNGAGYYRISYDQYLQQQLTTKALPALSLVEQVSLLRNMESLLSDGLVGPAEALPLAVRFSESPARDLIETAVNMSGSIARFVPHDSRENYARFLRNVFGAKAVAVGWVPQRGEHEDVALLRRPLLNLLASYGKHPEIIGQAKQLAAAWLRDRNVVDRGIAPTMLAAAARHGDQGLFEQFRRAYDSSSTLVDKSNLIAGIAGFSDPAVARQALSWMLESRLPLVPTRILLNSYVLQDETGPVVRQFLADNYDKLAAQLPSRMSLDAGTALMGAAGNFCDAAARDDVVRLFAERAKTLQGGPRAFAQTLEAIDQCIARRAALERPLAEFLKAY